MYVFQTLYPYVLAAANVAMGWLLYGVLESFLGLVLLVAGICVLSAVLCDTVDAYTPVTRTRP